MTFDIIFDIDPSHILRISMTFRFILIVRRTELLSR